MPEIAAEHWQLGNGLTVLAESMPHLRSAAIGLLVPAGYQHDPAPLLGLANLTCEMAQRGAGQRDSRELLEAMDDLGLERTSTVGTYHTAFSGAMPYEVLSEVLQLYADIVQRPHLPADQLDEVQQLALQELRAAEDEPSTRLMQCLRLAHYGDPLGRVAHGTQLGVESTQIGDIQRFVEQLYQPRGSILALAGKIDLPALRQQIEQLFGRWEGRVVPPIEPRLGTPGYQHLEQASQQVHIGVSLPAVPVCDPEFLRLRGAVGVLSDGATSRLFQRIREDRGLCYTVYASCHSLRDRGGVFCYAGTSSERAQETLDLLLEELHRFGAGLEPGELDRLKVRLQSSLIMEQESCLARAGAMASDWFHLGRIRPLEEIQDLVDGLSEESILSHWRANPPRDMRIVTVGPQPLNTPFTAQR